MLMKRMKKFSNFKRYIKNSNETLKSINTEIAQNISVTFINSSKKLKN